MISYFAKSIADFLFSKSFKIKEKREICIYGIEIILATFVSVSSILLVGLIFNRILESVVFFLVFATVRSSTGGYHADSYAKCNLILIVNVVVVLLIYDLINNFDFSVMFGKL